jgi:hypothetical protein
MAKAKRVKHDAKTTLLCAVRFWSVTPGVPTLRSGARHVALKQGYSAAQLNKAERELIREGLLERGKSGGRGAATLRVTPAARKRSCVRVRLAPWTNDGYVGADLKGRR